MRGKSSSSRMFSHGITLEVTSTTTIILAIFLMMNNLMIFGVSGQTLNAFLDSEKQLIVDKHNNVRMNVIPTASNMATMVWDEELAQVAANYAEKCIWGHNADRTAAYGKGTVGENLYLASAGMGNVAENCVKEWAAESQYFTYPACQTGQVCGHYTQVIWATTTKVGCARKVCQTLSGASSVFNGGTIVVCDYNPAGNYIGQSPYIQGAPPVVNNTTNNNNTNINNGTISNNSTNSSNNTNINNGTISNNTTNTNINNNTSINNGTVNNNSTNSNNTNNGGNNSTPNTLNAFTSAEKIALLDKQNEVRLSKTLNPPAASMGGLVWDDDLEKVAANYVDKCLFAHNDDRSDSYGKGYVGENLAISVGIADIVSDSVSGWAEESKYFTYPTTCQTGHVCGHYTQLIWENTKKVGCAKKKCATVPGYSQFSNGIIVVCNYFPGGNYNNENPYVKANVIAKNSTRANSSNSAFKLLNIFLISMTAFIMLQHSKMLME